jgi:colicin import membrane protein
MTVFPGLSPSRSSSMVGLNRMICLSLFLHVLLFTLIVFVVPTIPSPKWTFGPAYSVQLVSMPASLLQERPSETPLQKERPPADLTPVPVVSKKVTPLAPAKPADLKKPASDLDKAIDAIRRRLTASEKTAKAVPAKPADNIAASTAVTGTELDRRMKPYYAVIWSRIRGQWALPQGILPKENIEAIITAQILRNGTLADATFEKRSGNRYFDESALRAIHKASPFPPLPDYIGGAIIEVGVRFHSAELR